METVNKEVGSVSIYMRCSKRA